MKHIWLIFSIIIATICASTAQDRPDEMSLTELEKAAFNPDTYPLVHIYDQRFLLLQLQNRYGDPTPDDSRFYTSKMKVYEELLRKYPQESTLWYAGLYQAHIDMKAYKKALTVGKIQHQWAKENGDNFYIPMGNVIDYLGRVYVRDQEKRFRFQRGEHLFDGEYIIIYNYSDMNIQKSALVLNYTSSKNNQFYYNIGYWRPGKQIKVYLHDFSTKDGRRFSTKNWIARGIKVTGEVIYEETGFPVSISYTFK